MDPPDTNPPPTHFGDYPDGAYWSAERPAGALADVPLELTAEGNVIRFMWDYGVVVPLWTDEDGLLPDEPAWLKGALGLSDPLIADLHEWGTDMDHLDAHPSLRTGAAYGDLDVRARQLVERLQRELGLRFTVTYQAW